MGSSSGHIDLIFGNLNPNGGSEFPELFQAFHGCQKPPMSASEKFVTMDIPAFLRPLLRSMEHQQIKPNLSNE